MDITKPIPDRQPVVVGAPDPEDALQQWALDHAGDLALEPLPGEDQRWLEPSRRSKERAKS